MSSSRTTTRPSADAAAEPQAQPAFAHSVFDNIATMLATVRIPDKAPKVRDRGPDEPILATCDEYLQRLRMLGHRLADEIGTLRQSLDSATMIVMNSLDVEQLVGLSRSAAFNKLFGPNHRRDHMRQQVRELEQELRRCSPFAKTVDLSFGAELIKRFPKLVEQDGVVLCSDWTIVAETEQDRESDDIGAAAEAMINDLLGGGGIDAATLRRMGRDGFGARRRED